MKWFSIKGISGEVKKSSWPKSKDLSKNVVTVLTFIVLFGIFFVLSDFFIATILRYLGV